MSAIISARDAKRLANIASRLASDAPGERAAAALLGSRRLADLGLDWATVIARGVGEPVQAPRPPAPPPRRPYPRRTPSTPTVTARLRWLIGDGWSCLGAADQIWCIAVHDRGGPYTADELRRINAIVARVEAAAGVSCGTEIPL